MLWTPEAVEDLKKLALAGKSASHIAAALGVGSRNAVIGKASRIGIKLTGGGGRAAGVRRRRRSARGGLNGQMFGTLGRMRKTMAPIPPLFAICKSSQEREGARLGPLAKPRSGRCGGCGLRKSANPPAAGRSAIREAVISPIAGSPRSGASPIARAIAGWPTGRHRRGRAGSGKASPPSGIRGGWPEDSARRLCAGRRRHPLEHADQAGRVRARFAPCRC